MFKSKKGSAMSPSTSITSFHTAHQHPPENSVGMGLARTTHVSRTLAFAASGTPMASPRASTSCIPATLPATSDDVFMDQNRDGASSPSRTTAIPNSPSYTTANASISLFTRKPLTRTAPANISPTSSPSKSSTSSPSRPSLLSHSPSSRDTDHVKYAHGVITTREEWTVHGRGGMSSSAILNKPSTPAEHYWAARALTAEAILESKMDHQQELRSLKLYEDEKRTRDLAMLQQTHDVQTKEIKRILFFAISCALVLLVFLIYVLMTHSATSKQAQSKWTPHFTIPILSPFTSVIEHEVSTFGTTALVGFAAVAACLLYAIFRYWAGSRRRTS